MAALAASCGAENRKRSAMTDGAKNLMLARAKKSVWDKPGFGASLSTYDQERWMTAAWASVLAMIGDGGRLHRRSARHGRAGAHRSRRDGPARLGHGARLYRTQPAGSRLERQGTSSAKRPRSRSRRAIRRRGRRRRAPRRRGKRESTLSHADRTCRIAAVCCRAAHSRSSR